MWARLERIRNAIAKFRNSFDVSERNIFKERSIIICFSKSCLHGFYLLLSVLANIVVLYYIIVRYFHAEDISTEKTTKGCSSSLRMSPNTNLLLNDENVVTDKLQFISAWNISNEEPILSGDINSFPGIYQGVSKFFRNGVTYTEVLNIWGLCQRKCFIINFNSRIFSHFV